MRLVCLISLAIVTFSITGCDDDRLSEFQPELRLSTEAVDFGDVFVGARGDGSLSLINDGTGPIEWDDGPLIEAPFASGEASDATIPAGEFLALDLSFVPREEGDFRAELVLPLRDPIGEVRVPVRGVGLPNPLSLAPSQLDFGSAAVGETLTGTVEVTNSGGADVEVDLELVGQAFAFDGAGDRLTVTVAAGAVVPVAITFTPNRGGPIAGEVRSDLCDDGCDVAITLFGVGLAPRIEATPRPLIFDSVPLGSSSTTQLSLTNVGVGELVVSALDVTGNDSRILAAAALPMTIAEGQSADVEVSYTPDRPEGGLSETLIISSNDPLSPQVSVPILATTPGVDLQMIPDVLNFGFVTPDHEQVLSVLVRASGTEPVTVEGIELLDNEIDAFDLEVPSLPMTLAPGDSRLLSVVARANDALVTSHTAHARILATAGGGLTRTTDLEVTSTSSGCVPSLLRANVDLGFVRLGLGAQGSVFVENVGNAPCTLASIQPALGMPFDGGFSFASRDLNTIAPGDIGEVIFGFSASASGPASAVVSLRFDDFDGVQLVSATAYGVQGSLAPIPAVLDLGPVPRGCAVPDRAMTFVNEGADAVDVVNIELRPDDGVFTLSSSGARVEPGRGHPVTVGGVATTEGLFIREVAAETITLGVVTGTVMLEVTPEDAPVRETFTVAEVRRADVLFVVDNSGSMANDQGILATNFQRFIDLAAEDGGVDFHIGLTSTDVLSAGSLEGRLIGSPAFLTPNTPSIESAFQERATLGIDGSGIEMGLEAMRRATSEPNLSTTNVGFLRNDALLSIVIVTDEDDSGPFLSDSSLNLPPDAYIGHLEALKGGALEHAPVLVSLVGPSSAPRYEALVNHFGGVRLAISDADWGEELATIGAATFGGGRAFRLANDPQTGSISVTVDGNPVSFTVNGRTVRLDDLPDAGSQVEIEYRVSCS